MKRASGVTLEAFQELLRTSNLMSIDELARVVADIAHETFRESRDFARWLVDRKLVTRWQAQMMLAGKNRFFLGKYRLLERVGAGGMGTVFKAQQQGLGRIVALKVMSDSLLGDEQAVARFHREIRSAAALEHPNIVATFDADSVAGKHFLVMEFVDGENLHVLSKRRGRLPMAEACEYVRQAALGLAHAHERGMIHRDIKPANLLLASPPHGKEGPGGFALPAPDAPALPTVKILDFGLARLANEVHGDTAITQTGQIMGTPDYIAPEQARDTKAADIRSDIYSLGCTLFRLLTGEVPFRGQSVMEKLMARALEEAPRVRNFRPDLPAELDECLARMMARDPAARVQAPAEAAASLAPFASGAGATIVAPVATGEPAALTDLPAAGKWLPDPDALSEPDPGLERFLAVLATEAESDSSIQELAEETARSGQESAADGSTLVDPPPAAGAGEPRAARRRATSSQRLRARDRGRSYAAVGVLSAGLLLVAGLIYWYHSETTWLEIDWPDAERKGATLEIDGRQHPVSGKLSIAGRTGRRTLRMTRKDYEPIEESWQLARGERASYRPDWKLTSDAARRREYAALKKEIERETARRDGSFAGLNDPDLSAVRVKGWDFIHRWLDTPEASRITASLRLLPAPADGLRRETIPEHELRLCGSGNPRAAPAELVAVIGDSRLKHSANVHSVAFSPDDAWLAASDDTGFVKIWDTTSGELITALATAGGGVAFSPDGKMLLTGANDATAKIWDLESFRERFVLTGHSDLVFAVAYSPLGDVVATGGFDKTIRLWNPADGSLIRTLANTEGRVVAQAFNSDGTALAVQCADPYTAYILNVADGTRRFFLGTENEPVHSVAWSPDGSRVAVGSSAALTRLFDAATGEQLLVIATGQSSGVAAVSFSADGRTIASGSGDGTVALHNVATGAREEKLECHDVHLLSTVFSHHGRRLATSAQDQRIKLWDAATGMESPRIAPGAVVIAASPDGRWLALGNQGGAIDLWDIAANSKHVTLEGFRRAVGALAFSPDGLRLAAGGNSDDPSIRIWEIADPDRPSILARHAAYVSGLDFSPDGGLLASCAHDGLVTLWNVETGRIVRELNGKSGAATGVAFSRDGRTLAAGYVLHALEGHKFRAKLWDVARGSDVRTLEGSLGDVTGVAFSADDKTLTVGYWPRAVTNWDIARGVERETIQGTGIFALSADGSLSAIGTETEIKLLEPELSTPVAELSLGRSDVYAIRLAFTGEGRHLAVLALNGTVHILRLPAHRE